MSPFAFAHSISRTDASTSWSMIWAMPARRPGAWLQKSASHRLCACSPAHRRARSPVGGPRRLVDERDLRKERRDGVGEDHLGDDAVGLHLLQPAFRAPVAVGVGAGVVVVGVLELGRPRVELVVVLRGEERLVAVDAGAAVAVGGDDDVVAVVMSGGALHGRPASGCHRSHRRRARRRPGSSGPALVMTRALGWWVTSWARTALGDRQVAGDGIPRAVPQEHRRPRRPRRGAARTSSPRRRRAAGSRSCRSHRRWPASTSSTTRAR